AALRGQLGETPLPNPLQVHLEGPLSELIDIGSRASGATPVPIQGDGTAVLDLTVGGTLSRPLSEGTLVMRSPSLTYGSLAPVTDLTVDALVDPTLITLRRRAAEWQGSLLVGRRGGTCG